METLKYYIHYYQLDSTFAIWPFGTLNKVGTQEMQMEKEEVFT